MIPLKKREKDLSLNINDFLSNTVSFVVGVRGGTKHYEKDRAIIFLKI